MLQIGFRGVVENNLLPCIEAVQEMHCAEDYDKRNSNAKKDLFPSMKSRRSHAFKPENWSIVRNTHEPIIDQNRFDLVQRLITSRRSGESTWGENIFLRLLKCADCGLNMRRLAAHRTRGQAPLANLGYCCNRYARFGKEQCTYHWLEAQDLYNAVLADIQLHARQAMTNGDEFAKQIMERKLSKRKAGSIEKGRELKKSRSKLSELDGLFQRLYEDRASGAISERNYRLLANKYETEQQELEKRISDAEQTLKDTQQAAGDVQTWVNAIRQYASPWRTPAICCAIGLPTLRCSATTASPFIKRSRRCGHCWSSGSAGMKMAAFTAGRWCGRKPMLAWARSPFAGFIRRWPPRRWNTAWEGRFRAGALPPRPCGQ